MTTWRLGAVSLAALVTSAVASACNPHKTSPEELVAKIQGTGLHVEKKADLALSPDWVGADLAVDLELNYEETYQAVRFGSAAFARGYCEGAKAGIPIGGWCLEPRSTQFRDTSWAQLNALATR